MSDDDLFDPRDRARQLPYIARAGQPTSELRAAGDGDQPTLTGHFAVFDEWTEIDSYWEGRFLERLAPGAFKKTFREQARSIKVLFQHGRDPVVGDKPIGRADVLKEDTVGGYYEAPLFVDASFVRDLLPGLEAGVYGASFRFRVIREQWDNEPKKSRHNPERLPERTISEVQLMEFGPVTWPAYASATAGLRSVTDDLFEAELAGLGDRQVAETLRSLAPHLGTRPAGAAPTGTPDDRAATAPPGSAAPQGTPPGLTRGQREQALRRLQLSPKES